MERSGWLCSEVRKEAMLGWGAAPKRARASSALSTSCYRAAMQRAGRPHHAAQAAPRAHDAPAPAAAHLRYPPLPPLVALHRLQGCGARRRGERAPLALLRVVNEPLGHMPEPPFHAAENPSAQRPSLSSPLGALPARLPGRAIPAAPRMHPRTHQPQPRPTCRSRFSASAALRSRLCRSRSIFCHGICTAQRRSKHAEGQPRLPAGGRRPCRAAGALGSLAPRAAGKDRPHHHSIAAALRLPLPLHRRSQRRTLPTPSDPTCNRKWASPPRHTHPPTCLNTRLAPLNRSGCTSSAGSNRLVSFWLNSM